jgi:hypothetical protein
MRRFVLVAGLLSLSSIAGAESLWIGTWILREPEPGGQLTLKVEEVSPGWKLTYKVIGPGAPGASFTTILTPLDGQDVPVLIYGNPSGQTMGIKKLDDHHTVNVIKFKGKEIGVSKSELSSNGKMIRVETDYPDSNPGAPAPKQVQFWDRK